jgi:hypothetical protein
MLHPLITVIGFVLAMIVKMQVLWVTHTTCVPSLQYPEASSATTPRYWDPHSYHYTPSALPSVSIANEIIDITL